jgi:putative DNA-invertase from lambdoid prophage Rac
LRPLHHGFGVLVRLEVSPLEIRQCISLLRIPSDHYGLGRIAKGVGEQILAVLAQVADMERQRIIEKTAAGRQAARESLARTGLTHKGKTSHGRPHRAAAKDVAEWRKLAGASLAQTADHWGLSVATVKRHCAATAGV